MVISFCSFIASLVNSSYQKLQDDSYAADFVLLDKYLLGGASADFCTMFLLSVAIAIKETVVLVAHPDKCAQATE